MRAGGVPSARARPGHVHPHRHSAAQGQSRKSRASSTGSSCASWPSGGDESRFEVSEIEVRREGPSYTVDTLEELRTATPESELFLILGGDIAAGLPHWHRVERVLELATAVVAERRGTQRSSIEDALESVRAGERAQFFPMPPIGLSSTMIRERVRARAVDQIPRARLSRYLYPAALALPGGKPTVDDSRRDRIRRRRLRRGPQSARHRRTRSQGHHRLHRLLPGLQRPQRAADQGHPRRRPRGDEVRARHPARGAWRGCRAPAGS